VVVSHGSAPDGSGAKDYARPLSAGPAAVPRCGTISLLGQPQLPFAPDPYTTCLDLGAAGALATEGWDRVVRQTGAEAKELKAAINTRWIYPPTDDPALILAQVVRFGNGPRME
jgi:NADH dehydrogenase FAD-containing subunit